jgi:hypothetical protein
METKTLTKPADSDRVQIKAINEDTYWTKEYDLPSEYLKNDAHDTAIYDMIIEAHIKTQKSGN